MGGLCDLYVYADASGGVSIHVASRRRVLTPDVPEDPTPDMIADIISVDQWQERYRARCDALDKCALEPIGLSRDGQSFNLDFPEAARLVADLRKEGYQVPEGVEQDILDDTRIPDEAYEPSGCPECGEVATVSRYFLDVDHLCAVLSCVSCAYEVEDPGEASPDGAAKIRREGVL
jgi:hypothetical protein